MPAGAGTAAGSGAVTSQDLWLHYRDVWVTYDGGMSARLSIGLVARRTGATVPTVRYYEEIGLLPAASRTASGQRSYDEATVRRLVFIRRCRDFGFSIEQVRELVGLVDQPDRPCVEVRDIAASHLQQVRRKLDELKALETSLSAIVCGCNVACAGGAAVDCTILEDLAVPGEDPARAPGTGCCPPRAVETPLFNETQGHGVRPSG
jgi:DNA-binding transcriptional MerR regulator